MVVVAVLVHVMVLDLVVRIALYCLVGVVAIVLVGSVLL